MTEATNKGLDHRGSPDRFGHSWSIFSEILPVHEEQFLRWTTGLNPSDWQDKLILDAGCGIGRNSYWPLTYGAKGCLGIDIDDRTLAAATKNLAKFDCVTVDKRSVYDIREENTFDIAFSIGVIHHIQQPELAIQQMKRALKPGGLLLVWLYGYENNRWIVNIFNPFRKLLFSRMPLSIVYTTSYGLTAFLWLFLKLYIGKSKYLKLIRTFSFRHLRAIVYDHMIPKIAKYYTKNEAYSLLHDAGLRDVEVHWVNDMSWTVIGIK